MKTYSADDNLMCFCLRDEQEDHGEIVKYFGTDYHLYGYYEHGDVFVKQCATCARLWLWYYFDSDEFSNSSRWFRGVIEKDKINEINLQNAAAFLENLNWYLQGGEYFRRISKQSGQLDFTLPNVRKLIREQ